MEGIQFPALGEFVETIMKRKKITTQSFCSEQHVGGDNCAKLKKGII